MTDPGTVVRMTIRSLIERFFASKPLAVPGDGVQHQAPGEAPVPKTRRRLFTKYVALFVAVVCVALLSNGIFDVYFYYQEHKASLIRIQREQAEAAAAKIGQFIKEIESQLGWTTQLPWSAGSIEQRRFDALRLLRQVPAITELAQLDASGKERLRVSRLAMDVVASGTDFSNDPKFTEAVARKVYYGPVYFRRESEPYMTLAIAGTRRDAGVSVAEVNLKLIWDVVSQIKVGERGHAYVVDAQGRLIAHPDISLVLRNTDMSRLAQVRAARGGASDSPSETVQESGEHRRSQGAHGLRTGGTARLAGLRRAAGRRGLCAALCGTAATRAHSAGRPWLSRSSPGCCSLAAWSAPFGRCGPAPHASAAAICPSASQSRPVMNWRHSPTSSTTWPDGCRNPMPGWNKRSRSARGKWRRRADSSK